MIDRNNADMRQRLIVDGHSFTCAQIGPRRTCRGCYAHNPFATTHPRNTNRPRTMEAAYAALPTKARALMRWRK